MKTFDLKPSKEIGIIKETIKEAILEGYIPNEYEAAYELMLKEGERLGLKKDGSGQSSVNTKKENK